MNKLQTKRLKESKAHWERMRDDPECGEYPDSRDCACCQEYMLKDSLFVCTGCPIFEFTKERRCQGTPFNEASTTFFKEHRDGRKHGKSFKRHAQAEIDFLNEVLNQ